jgi:L-alanine-DL-glutamate epimerase-like enolase superfamily enzyme|tara:strand:+ start:3321 stop:4373 length:1053 start_codon:yes stop_codon:yes gene_type:complete
MNKIATVRARSLDDQMLSQLLVEVTTEDGLTGIGESWWGIPAPGRSGDSASSIAAALETILAPRAIGQDADRIEQIWYQLWDFAYRYGDQGILMMSLAGLDLALWDLLGKRLGVPVAQLLGGPVHSELPAYASLPPLRSLERVLAETDRAARHGFNAVKLHEVDVEMIRTVRDALGPDIDIMVDVNGHFDPVQAIAAGRELESCDIVWFEEPVRPMRDHHAIGRVNDAVDIDIAAGENEYSLEDFHRLLGSGAIAYLQPEITKIGGLTPAKRISALAELYNVALCPHNFRLGPSLSASIHWGLSCPVGRWIEIPWLPEDRLFPAGMPVPALQEGKVGLPEGAGLGETVKV